MTTQVLLDKLLRANVPIWIISLDLSKAFDRVSWPALWRALSQQGLSNHMIWMLQNLYRNQEGQVFANDVCSRSFPIRGGVRQGCVLSPRLFNSVLEMAMACWRASVEHLSLDLRDGGPANRWILCDTQVAIANGQRSTLHARLGSLFQAQGNICETASYIHQRLQKSKNSQSIEHHKP